MPRNPRSASYVVVPNSKKARSPPGQPAQPSSQPQTPELFCSSHDSIHALFRFFSLFHRSPPCLTTQRNRENCQQPACCLSALTVSSRSNKRHPQQPLASFCQVSVPQQPTLFPATFEALHRRPLCFFKASKADMVSLWGSNKDESKDEKDKKA